jgi:hypothetical protein
MGSFDPPRSTSPSPATQGNPQRGGTPWRAHPNLRIRTSTDASASPPTHRDHRSTRRTAISRGRFTPTRPQYREAARHSSGSLSKRTRSCRTRSNGDGTTRRRTVCRQPRRDPSRSWSERARYAAEPDRSPAPANDVVARDTSCRVLPGCERREPARCVSPAGMAPRVAARVGAPVELQRDRRPQRRFR